MHFEIYQNCAGAWRWDLFADGEPIGRPIAVSPIAYPSNRVCEQMLGITKKALNAPIYQKQSESGGSWVEIEPDPRHPPS